MVVSKKYVYICFVSLIVLLVIALMLQFVFIKYKYNNVIKKNANLETFNKLLQKEILLISKTNINSVLENNYSLRQLPRDSVVICLVVKFPVCEDCLFSTAEGLDRYSKAKAIKFIMVTASQEVVELRKMLFFEKITTPVFVLDSIDNFQEKLTVIFKKDKNAFIMPLPQKNEELFIDKFLKSI